DGAEMNDRLELAAVEPADQLAGGHDVGELAFTQIAPFARVAKRVVNHDVGSPGLVKAGDQIGPDEPGSAGDQQHLSPPPSAALPLCPRAPRRATSGAGGVGKAGGNPDASCCTGQAGRGKLTAYRRRRRWASTKK